MAELDDSALAKDFGEDGLGVFAAPTVIETEVLHHYHVRVVGRSETVRQQFYAISVERKIKHPAVVAICEAARQDIFRPRDRTSGSKDRGMTKIEIQQRRHRDHRRLAHPRAGSPRARPGSVR